MRILLAEDNEINQQLGVRLLQRHGHEVTLARDGEEVCILFQGTPQAFDLILMDVQMPRMSGSEAARRIREHEREHGGRVPILALTAHYSPEKLQGCLDAGMDAGVTKPLDVAEVEATLAQLKGAAVPDAGPANARAPVLGWDAALDLVLGDEALLLKMGGLFLGRVDGMLADIADAHGRGAARDLERAVHKLKGSVGNFGAQDAVQAATQVEAAAEAVDLAAAGELLPALREAVGAVSAELRRRLKESGA
jgi:CheY-like chemotaxis protein